MFAVQDESEPPETILPTRPPILPFPPPVTEPESEAAIIGGTILAGLGVAGTGVSGVLSMAGSTEALLPLGLGLGALGGGIALATYGAEEVVLGQTSTRPHLRIGPGSFDLRWSF